MDPEDATVHVDEPNVEWRKKRDEVALHVSGLVIGEEAQPPESTVSEAGSEELMDAKIASKFENLFGFSLK